MRDLTLTELDRAVAEQLPPRELMGSCGGGGGGGGGNTTVNVGVLNGFNVGVLSQQNAGSGNSNRL